MVTFVPLFGRAQMGWSDYSRMIIEKSKKQGVPVSATFELTPFCNFACNMCYVRLTPEQANKQGKMLNTEQWIHIAEEAKRLGTLGLEITGGEAITRPDFPVLYERFIRLGFLVSLRSNGYLLEGETLKLITKYKPRYVSITLYGASDETYKKVCGIENGFSTVAQNVSHLKEAGVLTNLTVTLTNDNYSDRGKLVEWAKNNGFFISFYGALITPIRAAKRSIEHLRINYDVNYPDVTNYNTNRIVKNREDFMHPFSSCRDYGSKFCVTWDGRMTLCSCFAEIWSDALSQSINDAYKQLYERLNQIKRPTECISCQYIDHCGACPVKFLSETGDYEKTCESLCRKAKISCIINDRKQASGDDSLVSELLIQHMERGEINED